jgi:hypothetical protein
MIALVAHAQGLVARLALLTQAEREAVLALVLIGRAAAGYVRGIRPDSEVIESFARLLESLSPEGVRRLAPQVHSQFFQKELAAGAAADGLTAQLRSLHAALVPAARAAAARTHGAEPAPRQTAIDGAQSLCPADPKVR